MIDNVAVDLVQFLDDIVHAALQYVVGNAAEQINKEKEISVVMLQFQPASPNVTDGRPHNVLLSYQLLHR